MRAVVVVACILPFPCVTARNIYIEQNTMKKQYVKSSRTLFIYVNASTYICHLTLCTIIVLLYTITQKRCCRKVLSFFKT